MWMAAAAAALALAPGATQNPDWVSRPTGDQLTEAYPERAMREGVAGKATIRCEVTPAGDLTACKVSEETPSDFGFGAAALKLAPTFKMSAPMRRGKAVKGVVTIPITFALGEEDTRAGAGAYVVRDLEWLARPTPAEVDAVFPASAREADVSGTANLFCAIDAAGGLVDCHIAGEAPAELGFGEAALKLASKFKAPATTADGAPTASTHASVPVVFSVRPPPQAQAATDAARSPARQASRP